MSFDTSKFLAINFKDRTAEVPVSELASFFDKDEKPIWIVKCLSAEDIARANDEVRQNTDIGAIVSALLSAQSKEKAEAVKELIDIPRKEKAPDDVVKRIAHLIYGSVSPVCSRDLAVKIGVNFPVTFYKLTNRILELSGKGRLGE